VEEKEETGDEEDEDEDEDEEEEEEQEDDPDVALVKGEEVGWGDVARAELKKLLSSKVPIPKVLLAKVNNAPTLKTWQKKK
jgi:hypothetical protein